MLDHLYSFCCHFSLLYQMAVVRHLSGPGYTINTMNNYESLKFNEGERRRRRRIGEMTCFCFSLSQVIQLTYHILKKNIPFNCESVHEIIDKHWVVKPAFLKRKYSTYLLPNRATNNDQVGKCDIRSRWCNILLRKCLDRVCVVHVLHSTWMSNV